MKNNRILLKNLLHLALILLGNAIYALAVTMFILPAGLITGGTTGLALFFFPSVWAAGHCLCLGF